MGYANSTPYTLFEFSCASISQVILTTVFSTNDIADITVPSFRGNPDYAYVDFYISGWENTAVGINYLKAGSSVGIRDSDVGHTFRDGGAIAEQIATTPGSTRIDCSLCLPGTINIAQYISSGETITPALYAKSHANDLYLNNVHAKIRMYFSVV